MSENQYIREGVFNACMQGVDKRLDSLDGRMIRIEDRMTAIEQRVGNVEGDVKALNVAVSNINDRMNDMNARISDLSRRFDGFREEMKSAQALSLTKWGVIVAIVVGAVQVGVSFLLKFWP